MEDRRQLCSNLRIGGQAVMEGVMMKGKEKYAVSVRKQDGSIITALFNSVSVTSKYRVLALPILRGARSIRRIHDHRHEDSDVFFRVLHGRRSEA